MQLNPSPLAILSQIFWEVSISGTTPLEHGSGNLHVERQVEPIPDHPRQWRVILQIKLNALEGEKPPPYIGTVTAEGRYEVHENYPHDPESLVRITGASMLYGVAREMVVSITARAAHGMLTLPSISFYDIVQDVKKDKAAPKTKVAKKMVKKNYERRRIRNDE